MNDTRHPIHRPELSEEHDTEGATRNASSAPRLTVEAVLWVLIALAALALRLANLGAAPLGAPEAREAMLAWRAVNGEGRPVSGYSPLLLAVNVLSFTLFGASDALARLWPALFGAALALTPLLLRRRLGRLGALAAGFILAISPTALVASRQLDGAMVAAAGSMAFVGGLVRFADSERSTWLSFAAVGLALALTGGPLAYGMLLPLALAWLLTQYVIRTMHHAPRIKVHVSHLAPTFIVAALALATGLGWNASGIGAMGGLVTDWLARFRPASSPAASPLTLLIAYEPLPLLFGLGGLIWGLLDGERFADVLALWAGLAFSLLLLMPGRAPLDLLWLVVPLALLAGLAVEALARAWRPSEEPVGAVYVLVVLVLWAYFYLQFARYAAFGDRADLALALMCVGLQVLLSAGYGMALDVAAALRNVAIGTGVALLALTLAAGWRAAYTHPADPRQTLVRQSTDVGVRDLVETLRDISWRETGLPTTLTFTLEAPADSVLAWYLRDFDAVTRIDGRETLSPDEVDPVLVSMGRDYDVAPSVDAEYGGQDFALRRSWIPRDVGCGFWSPGCKAAAGWFLFRDAPPLPAADQWATLWLREDWRAE